MPRYGGTGGGLGGVSLGGGLGGDVSPQRQRRWRWRWPAEHTTVPYGGKTYAAWRPSQNGATSVGWPPPSVVTPETGPANWVLALSRIHSRCASVVAVSIAAALHGRPTASHTESHDWALAPHHQSAGGEGGREGGLGGGAGAGGDRHLELVEEEMRRLKERVEDTYHQL